MQLEFQQLFLNLDKMTLKFTRWTQFLWRANKTKKGDWHPEWQSVTSLNSLTYYKLCKLTEATKWALTLSTQWKWANLGKTRGTGMLWQGLFLFPLFPSSVAQYHEKATASSANREDWSLSAVPLKPDSLEGNQYFVPTCSSLKNSTPKALWQFHLTEQTSAQGDKKPYLQGITEIIAICWHTAA